MNYEKYKDRFPYSTIRKEQEECIAFAIDSLIANKKSFCIIEAGT